MHINTLVCWFSANVPDNNYISRYGNGIAQLVESSTERPAAILRKIRVLCAARDFFSSADSLTVSVQTPCAVACSNICANVKNSKHWQPSHLHGHVKILHTLVGVGSAALAAAVLR